MDTALADLGLILDDFAVYRRAGEIVVATPRFPGSAALKFSVTDGQMMASRGPENEESRVFPARRDVIVALLMPMFPLASPYKAHTLAQVESDLNTCQAALDHLAEMLGGQWA